MPALEHLLKEIKTAKRENSHVEFKQRLDLSKPESKAEFVRDVIALANALTPKYNGPRALVVGISDNGEVVGSKDVIDGATIRDIISAYIAPDLPHEYLQLSRKGLPVNVLAIFPDPKHLYVVKKRLVGTGQQPLLLPLQSWERRSSGKLPIEGLRYQQRLDGCIDAAVSERTKQLQAEIKRLKDLHLLQAPLAEVRNLRYDIERTSDPQQKIERYLKLGVYVREYPATEVRKEVLRAFYCDSARVRHKLSAEIVAAMCQVLESIAWEYYVFFDTKLRRAELEVLRECLHYLHDMLYDSCKYNQDSRITKEVAEALVPLLRVARVHKAKQFEQEVLSCYTECRDLADAHEYSEGREIIELNLKIENEYYTDGRP